MNIDTDTSIPAKFLPISANSASNGKWPAVDALIPGNADPLLVAIEAYKLGCAQFCKLPDDDPEDEEAAIAATYGPPMEVLEEWTCPARSREAIIAALDILKAEHLVLDGLGTALLDACILGIKEGAL
ncbi:hypothetical protein HJC02_29075 [Rhizobium sp. NLR4a]|uniref:hypothetical protein n=1 Tax=Rhizobium sp. NLR4a TaxID=2731117 RepID=UPI001C8328EA|nr:hypothetical protein [Rhizobium sp. NLR4a]MBX5236281.1 hypothetical protein [Rhizobium sp. NLR4a]